MIIPALFALTGLGFGGFVLLKRSNGATSSDKQKAQGGAPSGLPVVVPQAEVPAVRPEQPAAPGASFGDVLKTAGSITAGLGVAVPIVLKVAGGIAAATGAGATAAAAGGTAVATGAAAAAGGTAAAAGAATAAGTAGAAAGTAGAAAGGTAAAGATLGSVSAGLSATGIGAIIVAAVAIISTTIGLITMGINNGLGWLANLTDNLKYEKSVTDFETKLAVEYLNKRGIAWSQVVYQDKRCGVRVVVLPQGMQPEEWKRVQLHIRALAIEYSKARLESGERLYNMFYPQNILPRQSFDRERVAKIPLIGGKCAQDGLTPFNIVDDMPENDPRKTNAYEAESVSPKYFNAVTANHCKLIGRLSVLNCIGKDPTIYALWDLQRYRENVFKAVFQGDAGVTLRDGPELKSDVIEMSRVNWPGMPRTGDGFMSISSIKDRQSDGYQSALHGVQIL